MLRVWLHSNLGNNNLPHSHSAKILPIAPSFFASMEPGSGVSITSKRVCPGGKTPGCRAYLEDSGFRTTASRQLGSSGQVDYRQAAIATSAKNIAADRPESDIAGVGPRWMQIQNASGAIAVRRAAVPDQTA
jgi:hypothetical protein